jgi:phosphatidylglycerol---prolipoprotein diacylglyceryl transferase
VYPTLFRIGHFPVATYGVVVAVAFLAAGSLAARGFRERGLLPDHAWNMLFYALVAGFLGAKIYFVLVNGPQALMSRGGFVWYGGFIGGAAAVLWVIRREKLPLGMTADALAPALALGHGIGHIACFFSGDSYGIPSDLPWAVAFRTGAPPSTAGNLRRVFGVDVPASIPDDVLLSVHPTMLYSAAALLAIAGVLWLYRRRSGLPGRLFALYLVLAATERFLVEFVRAKDDRFLWGGTSAQVVAVILMITGVLLLWKLRNPTAPVLETEPQEPVAT